jgi:hypothetical protein
MEGHDCTDDTILFLASFMARLHDIFLAFNMQGHHNGCIK